MRPCTLRPFCRPDGRANGVLPVQGIDWFAHQTKNPAAMRGHRRGISRPDRASNKNPGIAAGVFQDRVRRSRSRLCEAPLVAARIASGTTSLR